MENKQTPDQTARKLLKIFVADNLRAGEGMLIQALRARYGYTAPADELSEGLSFAERQGWLTIRRDPGGDFIGLTEAGRNAVGATTPSPDQTARKLLKIFVADNLRAGEGMLIQALRARYGYTAPADELSEGLSFAERQGWLTIRREPGGDFIGLTATGVAVGLLP